MEVPRQLEVFTFGQGPPLAVSQGPAGNSLHLQVLEVKLQTELFNLDLGTTSQPRVQGPRLRPILQPKITLGLGLENNIPTSGVKGQGTALQHSLPVLWL